MLLLSMLAHPAAAQLYRDDRYYRSQEEFFNPFRNLFGPRERLQRPRQEERPPPAVDYSKAPPPAKRETPPQRTIVVVGATLADWLAYGLEDAFADQPEIGILRRVQANAGLLRSDGQAQALHDLVKDDAAAAIVVLIGLQDRQSIRETTPSPSESGAVEQRRQGAAAHEFRSPRWAELYAKRIDETAAALKAKGVPVLWVGLPPIRGTRSMSDMVYLNDLFRARVERAGLTFVDVWNGFTDEGGRFATNGPDVDGQPRRLRTPDGVHFTRAGARKLAHFVERELKRVMGPQVLPVALPAPEEPAPTTPPAAPAAPDAPPARPLVGPAVSLTQPPAGAGDLLGGPAPTAPSSDPLVMRVLVKGEAVPPRKGRADDFSWAPGGTPASAPTEQVSADTPLPPDPVPDTAAAVPDAAAAAGPSSAAGAARPAEPRRTSAPAPAERRPPPRESRAAARQPPPPPPPVFDLFGIFRSDRR